MKQGPALGFFTAEDGTTSTEQQRFSATTDGVVRPMMWVSATSDLGWRTEPE